MWLVLELGLAGALCLGASPASQPAPPPGPGPAAPGVIIQGGGGNVRSSQADPGPGR